MLPQLKHVIGNCAENQQGTVLFNKRDAKNSEREKITKVSFTCYGVYTWLPMTRTKRSDIDEPVYHLLLKRTPNHAY